MFIVSVLAIFAAILYSYIKLNKKQIINQRALKINSLNTIFGEIYAPDDLV